jgi:hypothetical protein
MTTVCRAIADEYQKNYGVKCEVITSAPFFEDLEPSPTNKNGIRMIHHGGLSTSRRLENMIFLMDYLDDRFSLDFMLINNNQSYHNKLRAIAKRSTKIRFRDAVPMKDIAKSINSYDIGLFLLWPGAFSYKMALPNKLFEFIQGRLAIAIWPSPEMARVVEEYDLGIISNDFSIKGISEKLNSLSSADVMKFKMNAHHAANTLCAEQNKNILLNIIEKLLMNHRN